MLGLSAGVRGGLCNPSVWEAGICGWFEAGAHCCMQVHVEPASALSLASIWTPFRRVLVARSSKEVRIGPGGQPSSSKCPQCQAVVGQR